MATRKDLHDAFENMPVEEIIEITNQCPEAFHKFIPVAEYCKSGFLKKLYESEHFPNDFDYYLEGEGDKHFYTTDEVAEEFEKNLDDVIIDGLIKHADPSTLPANIRKMFEELED